MKAEVLRLRGELETICSFDGMVDKSKKMQNVYVLMHQTAEANVIVLIRGGSGTGKELVAKSIHFNRDLRTGPFSAVDSAAIPETLIESELCGHEPGVFMGATVRRVGKIRQC